MTSVITTYTFWIPLAILSLDSRFEEKTNSDRGITRTSHSHETQFQDELQVSCQGLVLRDKSRIERS